MSSQLLIKMENVVFCVILMLRVTLVLSDPIQHPSMELYFPEVRGDFSKITWAHAVNSWSDLKLALEGDVMMLECDVSLGSIVNKKLKDKIPVMAHPPAEESDLSLEEFLDEVIAANKRKGVKVDFKNKDIVEPSLKILENRSSQINFPVWINADIHPGPVDAPAKPVPAARFLQLCKKYFPLSVISPGWTTFLNGSTPEADQRYDWSDVLRMAVSLRHERISQPVTFPVRAAFLGASVRQLLWLTEVIPDSTITVWSGKSDTVDVNQLLFFAEHFAGNRVFYDLPSPLNEEFHQRKGAAPTIITSSTCKRGPLAKLAPLEGDLNSVDSCVMDGAGSIILPSSCGATFTFRPAPAGKKALIMSGSINFLPGLEISGSDSSISLSCGSGDNASGVSISQLGDVEQFTGRKSAPFQLRAGSFGQYLKQEFRFQVESGSSGDVVVTIWDSPAASGRDFLLQCVPADGSVNGAFRIFSRGTLPKLFSNLDFPCAAYGTSGATISSQMLNLPLFCAAFLPYFMRKRC